MSDYISKKKLISHIEAEYKSFGEDYDALQILGDIEDFKTEEIPQGEWIPWSERLPEERQVVLVTVNQTVLKGATHPVIIARYTTEKDSWIHTIPDAVLAWMPLPEPYNGGEAK